MGKYDLLEPVSRLKQHDFVKGEGACFYHICHIIHACRFSCQEFCGFAGTSLNYQWTIQSGSV